MGLYGIGQPVPREEDPRLLMGKGRYADDVTLPGQAHGVVLRSSFAHAVIRSLDADVPISDVATMEAMVIDANRQVSAIFDRLIGIPEDH